MRWLLTGATAALLALLVLGVGCRPGDDPTSTSGPDPLDLTLLALGDSYTIGQSIPEQWNWPTQLADSLAAEGDTLLAVTIVAQTGWTTRDLLDAVRLQIRQGPWQDKPFGLVALMIGVNNQFQGLDPEIFAVEMDTLIDLAIDLAGGRPDGVIGFSIPDYSVTPVGQLFDAETICAEIEAHNQILQQKYSAAGIALLDITQLSLTAAAEPDLVARDGLHYSRRMYSLWVELMLPQVCRCLGID